MDEIVCLDLPTILEISPALYLGAIWFDVDKLSEGVVRRIDRPEGSFELREAPSLDRSKDKIVMKVSLAGLPIPCEGLFRLALHCGTVKTNFSYLNVVRSARIWATA